MSSLLNAWYYLPVILQIWKKEPEPRGPEGEVYDEHKEDPGLPFRTAVLCMSIVVVLLGCLARPFVQLIARGVALL